MNFKDLKEGFNKIKDGYMHPPETNYDKTEHLKKLVVIVIIVLVLAFFATKLNDFSSEKKNERTKTSSNINQINTTQTENKKKNK